MISNQKLISTLLVFSVVPTFVLSMENNEINVDSLDDETMKQIDDTLLDYKEWNDSPPIPKASEIDEKKLRFANRITATYSNRTPPKEQKIYNCACGYFHYDKFIFNTIHTESCSKKDKNLITVMYIGSVIKNDNNGNFICIPCGFFSLYRSFVVSHLLSFHKISVK